MQEGFFIPRRHLVPSCKYGTIPSHTHTYVPMLQYLAYVPSRSMYIWFLILFFFFCPWSTWSYYNTTYRLLPYKAKVGSWSVQSHPAKVTDRRRGEKPTPPFQNNKQIGTSSILSDLVDYFTAYPPIRWRYTTIRFSCHTQPHTQLTNSSYMYQQLSIYYWQIIFISD